MMRVPRVYRPTASRLVLAALLLALVPSFALPASASVPPDAIWAWTQTSSPFREVWIRPLENDATYGWHNNLGVKDVNGNYVHNYHIRYNGCVDGFHQFVVVDTVGTGSTRVYDDVACNETCADAGIDQASAIAADIANDNADISGLYSKLLSIQSGFPDDLESVLADLCDNC